MCQSLSYNGDSWNLYIYWEREKLSNNRKSKLIIPEISIRKERMAIPGKGTEYANPEAMV